MPIHTFHSPATPALGLASVLTLASAVGAQTAPETTPAMDAARYDEARASTDRILRSLAARKLDIALEAAAQPDANAHSVLTAAARDAADALPTNSTVAARLRDCVGQGIDDVERTLESVASDLAFEPLLEAPLAEGWPPTAPVGEVVLKRYPTYRMAVADMVRASEGTAFWKLFQHIKTNDIPMTAPVQMDKPEGADRSRMGFLYQNVRVGETGEAGPVDVLDIEATWTISIGARGYRQRDAVDQARKSLESWLTTHGTRLGVDASGPARVMGYNGPSVPGTRRFYEVEIPVVVAKPKKNSTAANHDDAQ